MLNNRRFAYVDLIRGLSALVVLICHYRWFFAREPREWRTDVPLPLYDWLWPIYDHGGIAVQMFWLLSGFVFAVAYGGTGKAMNQREFWIRRIARLYPLHLATLFLVAGLQVASVQIDGRWIVEGNNDLTHFVAQLFFASNWFTSEGSFNGPISTVSVEVLIYPLFILYLKKVGLNLPWAVAFGAIGAFTELVTDNPIALCMALFFGGVVVAIVAPVLQVWLKRKLILLAGLLLATAIATGFGADAAGFTGYVPMLTIYLGTPAVLLLFIALDYNCTPLSPRLHWIGAITYSVYLLHIPLLIALRLAFGDKLVPILLNPLSLLAFAALVLAASVATYRWFELPSQRYIRRRWARPEATPAAVLAEQMAP